MEYCFNLFNKLAADGTSMAVDKFLRAAPPAKKRAAATGDSEPALPSSYAWAAIWPSATAWGPSWARCSGTRPRAWTSFCTAR